MKLERRAITVQGIVQGVGFRPFVYNLASRFQLHGFIKNQTGNVRIEVEGDPQSLDAFLEELVGNPPPLAEIDDMSWARSVPRNEADFRIEASEADLEGQILISPDVTTCRACREETLDSANRRYRYPFLNCTHCGPRLTIITGSPYDRPLTTMARFEMCSACRKEYENPLDRRFHAQPTCCSTCGPELQLLDGSGATMSSMDPLIDFVEFLLAGRIGALKGIGGYHLVCDATNDGVVAALRRRKHRYEKPFAVMVADLQAAGAICELSPIESQLLESPKAPIVLLRKLRKASVAESVAPANPRLGLMLPNTPLHHLLLREVKGKPLVMTSGNSSDEPIAYADDDAVKRLHGIADCFLVHNRPIHLRCDDSVTRVVEGKESVVRRSRGYAPMPLTLPVKCERPILALGGQLKTTFALGRGRQAIVSHHMGDLEQFAAYAAFERDIGHYEELFGIRPDRIVHDLHPDYASTRYARKRAEATGTELLAVQHHHAHMAGCMAENGLTGPVIGVTFDGTGYGLDGTIWGGEFLVGDYKSFRRAGHLRYVGLPGGEQAIHEPWRMALAHLLDSGCRPTLLESLVSAKDVQIVEKMIQLAFNMPWTSSMGRLFDAVASLIGLRQKVSYEGQAAIELEWLAEEAIGNDCYSFEIVLETASNAAEPMWIVDTRPIIRAVHADLLAGVAKSKIARRFHMTVVEIVHAVCSKIRDTTKLDRVVLSGGTFMNELITTEATRRLAGQDFDVFCHHRVPANDGGLSLGQLAVAASYESAEIQSHSGVL